MHEGMMLGGSKPKPGPYIGYNFGTDLSTGKTPIAVAHGGRLAAIANPYGYAQVANLLSGIMSITPLSVGEIGLSDFTLEILVLCPTTTNTYQVFTSWLTNANYGINVRFNDGGYGHRLVGTVNDNDHPTQYAANVTKSDLVNKWTHIAFQRKGDRIRMYVNGVQVPMTPGPFDNTYYMEIIAAPVNISGMKTLQLGHATFPANGYIAEFAVYLEALYSKNFTPTFPLVK